jgi:uncharacterized protein YuzE
MSITASYDGEVGALYVRLRDGKRSRSIETDDGFVIDVDADSNVLGIEALVVPVQREQIRHLSSTFGFVDHAEAVWSAITRVQPPWGTRSGVLITQIIDLPLTGLPIATGASSSHQVIQSHDLVLA